jgi:hypothetical protein
MLYYLFRADDQRYRKIIPFDVHSYKFVSDMISVCEKRIMNKNINMYILKRECTRSEFNGRRFILYSLTSFENKFSLNAGFRSSGLYTTNTATRLCIFIHVLQNIYPILYIRYEFDNGFSFIRVAVDCIRLNVYAPERIM